MTDTACGAPFARVPQSKTSKLSHLFVAGLMATTVLAATSVAHARITKIQILTRGTAFGGHSFAGVGQYEFITGIATGEVDPNNPQNSLITDIQLAPRNAARPCRLLAQFLHFAALGPQQGQSQDDV